MFAVGLLALILVMVNAAVTTLASLDGSLASRRSLSGVAAIR
jgi:hypothetical protein